MNYEGDEPVETDEPEYTIQPDVAEAIAATPLTSGGGGQFQNQWAATPEGQEYLSKHDEREKAEQDRADADSAQLEKKVIDPVDTSFVEGDSDVDGDEDPAGDEDDNGEIDSDNGEVTPEVVTDPSQSVADVPVAADATDLPEVPTTGKTKN